MTEWGGAMLLGSRAQPAARLAPVLGAVLLGACVDAGLGPDWPSAEGVGTRLVVISSEARPALLLHLRDPQLELAVGESTQVLVLDYACGDVAALGFAPVGEDGLAAPQGPVRAPDAAFELRRDGSPRFERLEVTPGQPELEGLPWSQRFPSSCRLFAPVEAPIVIPAEERSRFLLELPDRSVLFGTWDRGTRDPYLQRFTSPGESLKVRLPATFPADAAAVEPDGTLWLYGRAAGALARGSIDDLPDAERVFERLPSGAPAHPCPESGAGGQNDSVMAVRSVTGTVADVLVLDGSGTLQLFRRGRWTTLLDPVGAGQLELLCQVTPIQVLWEGPNQALMINRGVEDRRWQVTRVTLDDEDRPHFSDAGAPAELRGVGRLLDLRERGVYAGGGLGRIARRQGERWTLLSPDTQLTRNTAILFQGPAGALIVGNGGEGLAQYWPDEPGGPLACATIANVAFIRAAGRLRDRHILGLPSNEGQSRRVFAWEFRPPTECELPPD